MLCLDSYVIMDLLSGQESKIANCKKYLSEIETKGGVISSVLLTEVFFHIARRSSPAEAANAISFLRAIKNLAIVDVTQDISLLAGNLRAKYYSRRQREISFMDCIHLATAIIEGCKVFVTGDKDFKGVEEIEAEVY